MYRTLFFLFCVIFFPAFSQVGPRTWQDNLGINSCNTVTKNGSTVYASNYYGLVKFNEEELVTEPLNKINGLSDIGIRLLRTNTYNSKVLVIYDNSNIDIIDANGNIINYPDIKLKSINGKKIINEVTFDKQYAYLACGFGIIVFDTDKLETKETYIIGPNATNMQIQQIALNDTYIFAATPVGMYRANRSSALNNYVNWTLDTLRLPKGIYCGVQNVQGKIVGCYCPSTADVDFKGKDSVFVFANNNWTKLEPNGQTIIKMGPVYKNLFSTVDPLGLIVKDIDSMRLVQQLIHFDGVFDYGTYRDSYFGLDHSKRVSYWIADARFGLNQFYEYYDPNKRVTRNGMNKSIISNIDIFKGKVAVSPSLINNTGSGNYSREGINTLREGYWSYLKCLDDDGNIIQDVTSVLWDRIDTSKMWIASWYYGVMQFKNNKAVRPAYTPTNNPTMSTYNGEPRCSGLSMDKQGNLWFASSDQKAFLNVIKKNGGYQSFTFDVTHGFARKTFTDRNNYVWVLHERDGGLTVYKHNNFEPPRLNSNYKWLSNSIGNGNLQSNSIYSIAEDLDGKIWIGTSQGISVFYNPTAIFNGGNFDSQPIKIIQDGNVELLLGKEIVTAIKADGANNKWCGTQSGGVYCFSPDGLKQLYHFTKENSPLYSNTIIDINYNDATGDVFFGTEAGLQSFRGIVVVGEEDYSSGVYAYPNPVKPGYLGTVLIRGLVDDSIVKIVDESGNMVWEAKSSGGQIEWPITTFANTRATSGVYIVYASNATGELRASTKILVVN
ncbi:type IX secretion system anionic LPS delivery protein PorZ [Aurantibacillus circumpalustris]|uniref:type IX secretion system anionic LPS delivery protein PorZ n=1 Tax=Aurantibacillus circumpalustris TaxID=3036359 RepID=UPI00295C1499|nr:two-component regulator propeller domain-containing protein [Aurantibacillus circumpalustris]